MLQPLILLICALILLNGALAVMLEGMIAAIAAAGLAGLFAALVFLLMAAPDVAMTEAAIGSGLSTFIFLYALWKTRPQ